MQMPGQSLGGELELLEYRQQRIEELLDEGIVSAEMETQLRHTLSTIEQEVQSLRAHRVRPAHRRAA